MVTRTIKLTIPSISRKLLLNFGAFSSLKPFGYYGPIPGSRQEELGITHYDHILVWEIQNDESESVVVDDMIKGFRHCLIQNAYHVSYQLTYAKEPDEATLTLTKELISLIILLYNTQWIDHSLCRSLLDTIKSIVFHHAPTFKFPEDPIPGFNLDEYPQ